MPNPTHRKTLARELTVRTAMTYQQALAHVTELAESGMLPRRLDATGMRAALQTAATTQPPSGQQATTSARASGEPRGAGAHVWCPYAGCVFGGPEDTVDDHRCAAHRDEPQAGGNLRGRPRVAGQDMDAAVARREDNDDREQGADAAGGDAPGATEVTPAALHSNELWQTPAREIVKVSTVYPTYVTGQVVYPMPARTTVRAYQAGDVAGWREPTSKLFALYERAWGFAH